MKWRKDAREGLLALQDNHLIQAVKEGKIVEQLNRMDAVKAGSTTPWSKQTFMKHFRYVSCHFVFKNN